MSPPAQEEFASLALDQVVPKNSLAPSSRSKHAICILHRSDSAWLFCLLSQCTVKLFTGITKPMRILINSIFCFCLELLNILYQTINNVDLKSICHLYLQKVFFQFKICAFNSQLTLVSV